MCCCGVSAWLLWSEVHAFTADDRGARDLSLLSERLMFSAAATCNASGSPRPSAILRSWAVTGRAFIRLVDPPRPAPMRDLRLGFAEDLTGRSRFRIATLASAVRKL